MFKWKIAAEITKKKMKNIKLKETQKKWGRGRTIMVDGQQKRISRIRIDNLK